MFITFLETKIKYDSGTGWLVLASLLKSLLAGRSFEKLAMCADCIAIRDNCVKLVLLPVRRRQTLNRFTIRIDASHVRLRSDLDPEFTSQLS